MHWVEKREKEIAKECQRVSFKYRLSQDEADDLFQDVRIRLLEKREDVPPGYIYRVAQNSAIDFLRKELHRKTYSYDSFVHFDPPEKFSGVDEVNNALEIESLLEGLGENGKLLLNYAVRGSDYLKTLDCAFNTARVKVHKAQKKLREKIA